MVAGVTHPHIRRREGDQYRLYLEAMARDLGVASHVIFHNKFVSAQELSELIGSADIYITPYKHKAQVVSGTLARALSAGKAIISTPICTRSNCLTRIGAFLFPLMTHMPLPARHWNSYGTRQGATPCASAPICMREAWYGTGLHRIIWEALNGSTTSGFGIRKRPFPQKTLKKF